MSIELNITSTRITSEEEGYVLTEQDILDLQTEYQRICAFWSKLTQDEIDALVVDNTVTTQIETNNNQAARGAYYTGRSEFRQVYVHTLTDQVLILPDGSTAIGHDWITIEPSASEVYNMLAYGLNQSVAAQTAIVTVNGGTFPEVLAPKV